MRFEFVLLPDSRHSAGDELPAPWPVFAWSNVFALQAWSEEWLRRFSELNQPALCAPDRLLPPTDSQLRTQQSALSKADRCAG